MRRLQQTWLAISWGWRDAWLALTRPNGYGGQLWAEGAGSHWHPRVARVIREWDDDYAAYCERNGW